MAPMIVVLAGSSLFALAGAIASLAFTQEELRSGSWAAIVPLLACGSWPIAGIVAAIAYRYRRGAGEEWCVDDRELVMRESPSGAVIERVPFSHIEYVRFRHGRSLSSAIGLWKRGRSQPSRLLLVELPTATIVELLDRIAERCADFRGEGTREPAIETQVKLAPNWYSRGAEVACPNCGATRLIASAARACPCGHRGWPAEWVVIPFAMMFPTGENQPSPRFAWLRMTGRTPMVPTKRPAWSYALAAVGLAIIVVATLAAPGPMISGALLPIAVVIGSQLFPYFMRPMALAVVTPEGVFGLDDRGRWEFDAPPRVSVSGLSITLDTPSRQCVFWGRRSRVKQLAEALAARRTEAPT